MKTNRNNWKSFNTPEDFQNFIDTGNYQTRSDLEKVLPSFFTALIKKGFSSSDIHFPIDGRSRVSHKYDNLANISDFQKFIEDNKIISLKDFTEKYSGLLAKYRSLGFSTKDLVFENKSNRKDYSKLNTIKDIQEFIDSDIDINTSTDFIKKYGGLYLKMKSLGLNIKSLVFRKIGKKDLSKYKTLEDIKEYIKENGIITVKDLVKNHNGIYHKLKNLGYKPTEIGLIDSRTLERENKKWSKYKTLEDLQRYIDDSGCKNLASMKEKNGFISKVRRLGFSLSDLNFPDKNKSGLEIIVEDFLKEHGINYISQKVFKDYNNFRFDFYLPEYNLILEPGGDQHLIPIDIWGGEEEFIKTRERDIKKKEFCESIGLTVLYMFKFSNKKVYSVLEKEGFLGSKYYTDINDYFNEILKLINDKKK